MIASSRADLPDSTSVDTYAALSLRFRVVADDEQTGAEFARLYGACVTETKQSESAAVLELDGAGAPGSARFAGGPPQQSADRNGLLLAAMALVDGAAIEASAAGLLLIHASAALTDSGPVLLVGPSGAGKSTLAAALGLHGWPYVGDEALGLDEAAVDLYANPKPLKLDRDSRSALFARWPSEHLGADARDHETLVAPHELGPVVAPGPLRAPVAVVAVAYRPGAAARVTPMTRGEVAEAVADQCFNFARWGARGLDTVAALARTSSGCRLEFGDIDGALAQIEALLG